MLISALLVGGCAALRPPVDFQPAAPPNTNEHALRVEPVEGRPNGLVLRLRCGCTPPNDGWLEILRRQDDQPAQVYRSVRLNARLAKALAGKGLPFLDRAMRADTTTTYQVRLRASANDAPGKTLERSIPRRIAWQKPPARPANVRAQSHLAGSVELHWQATGRAGALIFRRDVLRSHAPVERIAQVGAGAGGVFVDRHVQPGAVYAYRVALASHTGDTLQFGPPSDEIYVTVRAAPIGQRSRRGSTPRE